MAQEVLRFTDDGESYCRIVDPASGPIRVPMVELSSQEVLLDTRLKMEINDYIDVTLVLRGLSPRQLFAHVATCDKDGVRLRWLHFDPADETKLTALLQSFQEKSGGSPALSGPKAAEVDRTQPIQSTPAPLAERKIADITPVEEHQGTRRVIRPRQDTGGEATIAPAPSGSSSSTSARRGIIKPSTVITPFSSVPSAPAKPASEPSRSESARVGTRRVVRPSQTMPAVRSGETGDAKSSEPSGGQPLSDDKASGEDSPSRAVAIEPSGAAPTLPDSDRPSDEPLVERGESKRASVIGQDGKLDIGASIRSKAKTMRASELAARHDKVRVLNFATIRGLIQEAVSEAAAHLTQALGEGERKRLLEEAEESFKERLKSFNAEKLGWESQAKVLGDQLKMAQQLLEEERKRSISADQFTVSAAGLDEIDTKMEKVLMRVAKAGSIGPTIEQELRTLIAHILDSERERIREKELAAQNAKISLLEKKVQRLAGSLEESERQREEAQQLAQALEAAGGGSLRNVFTAGIKEGDPGKQRKLSLMKEILDINREIRNALGIALTPVEAPVAATIKPGTASIKRAETAPEPAPVEPTPSEEPEASSAGDDDASSGINPDDLPWEVQPIQALGDDDKVSGIKRIKGIGSSAPPLERKPSP